jgi:hypothetical protein
VYFGEFIYAPKILIVEKSELSEINLAFVPVRGRNYKYRAFDIELYKFENLYILVFIQSTFTVF